MVARNGRISRIITVVAAVLFLSLAVAEAGSTRKPYSPTQKRKTPYDILRETRSHHAQAVGWVFRDANAVHDGGQAAGAAGGAG